MSSFFEAKNRSIPSPILSLFSQRQWLYTAFIRLKPLNLLPSPGSYRMSAALIEKFTQKLKI